MEQVKSKYKKEIIKPLEENIRIFIYSQDTRETSK